MKRIVYLFAVILIMATVEAQTLTERQKGLARCTERLMVPASYLS